MAPMVDRLVMAANYYRMAERIRDKAAKIEDEARGEIKDAYERKLQAALDRYQDALRAHPVGR